MKRARLPLAWIASASLLVTACGDKSDDDPGATGSGDETTGETTGAATDSATTSASTSTGGTTSMGSGTSTTTGDDTGSFIDPPDGGVSGQCDPKTQDCPEGEKCSAYGAVEGQPWNANKCVPDTGDGQIGDPCDIEGGKYTGIDNCDVGLICLLSDDDGKGGACVEFCDGNNACSDGSAQCVVYNDGSLPICLSKCDPLIQDCPDGQGCYAGAGSAGFICFKFSGTGGEGTPGSECNYVNQCQPGTACLAPGAVEGCGAMAGCCSPYCDLGLPTPDSGCNPTEDCVPWFEMGMAPPQYVDVGVCAIPA